MAKMIDAHAHIGQIEDAQARMNAGIQTIFCGTDPQNAEDTLRLCATSALFTASCAIHPWKAADYRPESLLPYLEQCPIVGETGLDSVWCDTPYPKQMEAFLWNLDYAQKTQKPVILHTKGREREIALILKKYSMPKIVHWYSDERLPDDYLEQGCYFTLGPDLALNPITKRLSEYLPLDRVMLETDGLSAVSWTLNRRVTANEIPGILKQNLLLLAKNHHLSLDEARSALKTNAQNAYKAELS